MVHVVTSVQTTSLATIGAFSAGIPTIPVAYSRKFEGLYSSLGYDYIIDASKLDLDKAISVLMEYLDNKDNLRNSQIDAIENIKKQEIKLSKSLKEIL